ncbi:MAG: DUF1697 domain-containing protein [Candidatus Moraniibacteriota bacterium]
MKKYIALLRGINVGGNSKVEMTKLREVFESLGFQNVSTYINSGNVIFESDAKEAKGLSRKIERALEKAFGFAIKTLVREKKDLDAICKAVPPAWKNGADQKTDVLFLWDEFDKKATLDLLAINEKVDHLQYISGAIVWNIERKHYNQSGMRKFIGTVVYKNMTARNINTVRKLDALMKN